jgi:hypothetical protein
MAFQLRGHACVAGSNFDKASDKEKRADFSKLGLTGYSGDKVISQRDIQRLVSFLLLCCSSWSFMSVLESSLFRHCCGLLVQRKARSWNVWVDIDGQTPVASL